MCPYCKCFIRFNEESYHGDGVCNRPTMTYYSTPMTNNMQPPPKEPLTVQPEGIGYRKEAEAFVDSLIAKDDLNPAWVAVVKNRAEHWLRSFASRIQRETREGITETHNTVISLETNIERLEDMLLKRGAMYHSPCFICGYNGEGYFDPAKHSCAERHHKLYKSKD